mmetsp:Transcript_2038/g.4274  ORF Transcript_2038/g.4274 Transcript_2038/m.4274 type:complete len:530 (+) Transcript_2038:116-1705(+)
MTEDASAFLQNVGLGAYAQHFEGQGYRTLGALQAVDDRTLAQVVKKPGHLAKLKLRLSQLGQGHDREKVRRLPLNLPQPVAAMLGFASSLLLLKLVVIGALCCFILAELTSGGHKSSSNAGAPPNENIAAATAAMAATGNSLAVRGEEVSSTDDEDAVEVAASASVELQSDVEEDADPHIRLQKEKERRVNLARQRVLNSLPAGSMKSLDENVVNRVFDSLLSNGEEYEYAKFYHLHVPKVGGSSFRKDIPPIIPTSSELITAERCYYDGKAEAEYQMTLVRRPRKHVESQYFHCSTSGSHQYGKDWMPQFHDWAAGWYWLRTEGKMSAFCCSSPVDMQSYRMTCPARSMSAGRQKRRFLEVNITKAIVNLKEMFFVGLLDAYDESICLLQARVRGELPRYCNCEVPELWDRRPHLTHRTHGTQGSREIREDAWELVDSITAGDIKLYNAAVERFKLEVGIVEELYGRKFLCKEIVPLPEAKPVNRTERFIRDISRRMKHYTEFLPRRSDRKDMCARRYGQMVPEVRGD